MRCDDIGCTKRAALSMAVDSSRDTATELLHQNGIVTQGVSMGVSVVTQEETSRKHRDALALHETRVITTETELQEIDASLPTIDADAADDLLARHRTLQDKFEWLHTQTAEL